MQILVINPNTTASMTTKIGRAARAVAGAKTDIVAVSPESGPPSIEGYYDEAFAVPGLIAEMRKAPAMDAYVIACFDDSGLDAARSLTEAPVLGIGEAAFHVASLVSGKFTTITTLSRSVSVIEHNLVKYGLASRCARVRAADVPVLELEVSGSKARERISEEIARALREDDTAAIVLGCAGMADLAAELSLEHGVPVVDGVAAAIKLAEGLVTLKLRTSKRGAYASPLAKSFAGIFASCSPTKS